MALSRFALEPNQNDPDHDQRDNDRLPSCEQAAPTVLYQPLTGHVARRVRGKKLTAAAMSARLPMRPAGTEETYAVRISSDTSS
jgi:hypothetical protein